MEKNIDSIDFLNNLYTQYGGDFQLRKGLLSTRLENILALFNNATNLLSQNRFDDAIRSFNSLLKIEPAFGAARINLAIAYFKDNYFNEAVKELDLLIRTYNRLQLSMRCAII